MPRRDHQGAPREPPYDLRRPQAPGVAGGRAGEGLFHRRKQRVRGLRTRGREPAIEDEERHALHADLPRDGFVGGDVFRQFVGRQERDRGVAFEADVGRGIGEPRVVREVVPVEEVRAEQRLDERRAAAPLRCPRDQAMGLQRVRLDTDAIEVERDARLSTGRLDPRVDLAGPGRAAELLLEIGLPVETRPREIGVELERVPRDGHGRIRMAFGPETDGFFEAAQTDEAPGADHVGYDVDGERHGTRLVHE
jgi:hypothetical protein